MRGGPTPAPAADRRKRTLARYLASGIALALAGVIPVTATAAIVSEATLFSTLCSETASTGFIWKAGHWAPSKFSLSRYRLQKLPPDRADCVFVIAREPPGFENDIVAIANGCYSVGAVGAEASGGPSVESCGEVWLIKDGARTLLHVSCRFSRWDLVFDPEGNFQLGSVPGDVSKTPEKGADKLYVSLGTCEME